MAYCKAQKVQSLLLQEASLYYTYTELKTETAGEWAKFLYSEVDNKKVAVDAVSGGVSFIRFDAFHARLLLTHSLRICVPVDVNQGAWVDDRCPLDDCGDISLFDAPCKKSFVGIHADHLENAIEDNIDS